MDSELAEKKNRQSLRQALVDLKVNITEMLEVDADQVMWINVGNLAMAAAEMQAQLNPEVVED